MFKICSYLPSSLYGIFMALKDPKIEPFKMTNCFDYTNLRSTQKVKSLGIISGGVIHTCGRNVDSVEHETITGYYRKDLSESQAAETGKPGSWSPVIQEKLGLLEHHTDGCIQPPPKPRDRLVVTELLTCHP